MLHFLPSIVFNIRYASINKLISRKLYCSVIKNNKTKETMWKQYYLFQRRSKSLSENNFPIIKSLNMAKYFRRVLAIAFASLFFTAVNNANLGIIGQLAEQNDNHWIGPLSTGLIFLGSGIGAIYNKYISKYPLNRIIFTGGLGWDLYCGFSVLFLFVGFQNYINAIIIIGSLVCGLTISLFYNGSFNYINQCGKRDTKSQQYFGLSLCINQSANILGGGFSALLVKPLGQKNYSLLMLGLGVLSSMSFIFLKNFEKQSSSYLISEKCIENGIQEQNQQKAQKKIPLNMFFCFGLSGVMISFVFSQFSLLFYRYFPDMQKQELNHVTFVAFMIQGCGEFIGGLTIALLSKNIKNIGFSYTLNGLLFLGTVGILYLGFQNDQIFLIYIGSFTLGFADCFCFSMGIYVSGYWKQSGISLFNAGQSITVALLSVPTIFFSLPLLSIIYICLFLLSTVALQKNRKAIGDVHLQQL